MGHSMGAMINKKTLVIAAVLLVGALIAVYGFNVSWRALAPFGFVALFVWMHAGGHGMHGGSLRGQDDDPPQDQHASHSAAAADSNARALAPNTDVRPGTTGTEATAATREAPRRHGGC